MTELKEKLNKLKEEGCITAFAEFYLSNLFTEERNKLLKEVVEVVQEMPEENQYYNNGKNVNVYIQKWDTIAEIEKMYSPEETNPDNWDSKEGQTNYCVQCEMQANGISRNVEHTCGKEDRSEIGKESVNAVPIITTEMIYKAAQESNRMQREYAGLEEVQRKNEENPIDEVQHIEQTDISTTSDFFWANK